jgi:hypothetical protein
MPATASQPKKTSRPLNLAWYAEYADHNVPPSDTRTMTTASF